MVTSTIGVVSQARHDCVTLPEELVRRVEAQRPHVAA
jgi:hypothetical protein